MYESDNDLKSESGVVETLCTQWRCEYSKLPIRYHLDYVLRRKDKAVAFCEVKSRSYTMSEIDSMGGYLMSVGKWMAGKSMSEATGLPFILAVKTTDGIWYGKFTEFKPDDVLVRGRTDRNDWQDIEPCVLLNCNRFVKI
jgi:hypothetical protein